MQRNSWALYKGGKVVGVYLRKSVAMRRVDSRLGTGLFAPRWDGLAKGDYRLIPCKSEFNQVYLINTSRVHSENDPTIFSSLNEVAKFVEAHGLKVTKKKAFRRSYRITTDKGTLEGEIVEVV